LGYFGHIASSARAYILIKDMLDDVSTKRTWNCTATAQTLYALRVLRAHGLHDSALHNIYGSVVLAKLLYASSSWIGFSNATDRQKLQAFLNRSKRSSFCDSETDDFATLCSTADKQLFNRIL